MECRMTAVPVVPTTALAIPEKGAAIARIFADLRLIVANMLPDSIGRRRCQGLKARLILVDEMLVMSPTSPMSPFVAQVIFRGTNERCGTTTAPVMNGDAQVFGEDGKPLMCFVPDYDRVISGMCQLPDLTDPTKRVGVTVRPLKMLNERGGLIPYVNIDPSTGDIRAGKAMHCIFIKDVDMRTGKFNGRVRAIPLGLAQSSNITPYNDIVKRLSDQDSGLSWESIEEIGNNFGCPVRFLNMKPNGSTATLGLSPVWNEWNFSRIRAETCDYWIVARFGGKVAVPSRSSQSIIVRGEDIPEQVFTVEERWNSIELTVLGLPGEIGETNLRELDQGKLVVDWLTLFGASLYGVHPNSGSGLLRRMKQNPPIDAMASLGLIPPGGNRDLAIETLNGLGRQIVTDIRNTVLQAHADLVHNLSPGGTEALSLSLADVLGGEPTSELLETALKNSTENNLLVIGILASTTASNLGFEVWDPKCWVLRETYKTLLMNMAEIAGVELPLPPEADASPAEVETPVVDTSSPSPPSEGEQTPAL